MGRKNYEARLVVYNAGLSSVTRYAKATFHFVLRTMQYRLPTQLVVADINRVLSDGRCSIAYHARQHGSVEVVFDSWSGVFAFDQNDGKITLVTAFKNRKRKLDQLDRGEYKERSHKKVFDKRLNNQRNDYANCN